MVTIMRPVNVIKTFFSIQSDNVDKMIKNTWRKVTIKNKTSASQLIPL